MTVGPHTFTLPDGTFLFFGNMGLMIRPPGQAARMATQAEVEALPVDARAWERAFWPRLVAAPGKETAADQWASAWTSELDGWRICWTDDRKECLFRLDCASPMGAD